MLQFVDPETLSNKKDCNEMHDPPWERKIGFACELVAWRYGKKRYFRKQRGGE